MKRKLFFLFVMISMIGTKRLALDQKDGVYQIGTAEDLMTFAELVNGGENTANAVLTAGINLTQSDFLSLIIGNENAPFCGVFDGKGLGKDAQRGNTERAAYPGHTQPLLPADGFSRDGQLYVSRPDRRISAIHC